MTELLLGFTLPDKFRKFKKKSELLLSGSQPICLVVAAYLFAEPYLWIVIYSFWVAGWWAAANVFLPTEINYGKGIVSFR